MNEAEQTEAQHLRGLLAAAEAKAGHWEARATTLERLMRAALSNVETVFNKKPYGYYTGESDPSDYERPPRPTK